MPFASRLSVRLGVVLGLFVAGAACGPRPGEEESSTGASSSGPTSESGTTTTTTGVEPTSTSTTTTTSTSTSTGEATNTSSEPDTGTDASGSSGGTSTGPVDDCSLENHAAAIAGAFGEFEDCGVVGVKDDVAAWQAAHDCAAAAASEQRAFALITYLMGIDSQIGAGYVAQGPMPYRSFKLHFDSDPCGGGGCGSVVSITDCKAITAVPGCTVEPGTVCLSCEGGKAPEQICPPI